MRLVTDQQLTQRGDFYWLLPGVDDVWYGSPVPEGCRALIVALPTHNSLRDWDGSLWTIGYRNTCNAQWSWDGNETSPTLHPSLNWVGYWHGWIRAGQLVEAA